MRRLFSCCHYAENIERNTLLTKQCQEAPEFFSKRTDHISAMDSSEEESGESAVDQDYYKDEYACLAASELKTQEYGPSAISFNAVVTLKYSASKFSRTFSAKPSLRADESMSVDRLKTLPKLRRYGSGTFTPSSTQRTLTESCTSSSSTNDPVTMTKILPHLYLGCYDDAINELELQKKGITHILSLFGKKSHVDFVQHEISPMHDLGRTDVKKVLEKVSKFVEVGQLDGNNILIHCQSGQNRSAVLVIALMMKNLQRELYHSHKHVKSLRPIIQINEGYAKQLLTLEKEIFGKNSLPSDWMEREDIDLTTGEVTYKYEQLNSAQYKELFDL